MAYLITAAELAKRLGVSRDYVYAHASELGALRLGTGSKPRLRFRLEAAELPSRRPAATPPVIVQPACLPDDGLAALPERWRRAVEEGRVEHEDV